MNVYRVLMEGRFNGELFNFAIFQWARSRKEAVRVSREEFPDCDIASVSGEDQNSQGM